MRILLSWSSGKDSAWALHTLRQGGEFEVAGLFCTINRTFDRVAMHAVRESLVRRQAEALGLPVEFVDIPHPCSNTEYEARMSAFVDSVRGRGIEHVAFGDLFLEDVRAYREKNLAGTGLTPVFPLWGAETRTLSRRMVEAGLRAHITCIDPRVMPYEWIGRTYDGAFLRDLPDGVDPCGENGEFHSFAYDGPMFRERVSVSVGETVDRDGFVFADVY